jgi:HAD superfamily hydrolase (TIGR01509 family)
VVFDCDGLLLDTETCWTYAERALFARYDRVFGPTDKQAMLGKAFGAAGRILERLLDQPGRADELGAELYDLVRVELLRGASPMPGAAELVEALRGRRPIAVASNSLRDLLTGILESSGLAPAFPVVLGGDDVADPKPAPDIYLRACELLGAAPSQSIALEDSPTGAAAARAAGLYVIGVPSLPDTVLDADLVVPSLGHPDVWRAVGLDPVPA